MSDQVLPAEAAASPAAIGTRVLVIDADDRTRESMVGILGIRHRFTVIGSTGQVSEAIAIVRDKHPDVVKQLLEGVVQANDLVNSDATKAKSIVNEQIGKATGPAGAPLVTK